MRYPKSQTRHTTCVCLKLDGHFAYWKAASGGSDLEHRRFFGGRLYPQANFQLQIMLIQGAVTHAVFQTSKLCCKPEHGTWSGGWWGCLFLEDLEYCPKEPIPLLLCTKFPHPKAAEVESGLQHESIIHCISTVFYQIIPQTTMIPGMIRVRGPVFLTPALMVASHWIAPHHRTAAHTTFLGLLAESPAAGLR